MPDGSAQTSLRPVFFCQLIRQPGVVERRQAQHQPDGRQDAAENDRVRHVDDVAQQAGQHQQIDQNIGAKSKQRVPVARRPEQRLCGCGHDASPSCRINDAYNKTCSMPAWVRWKFLTQVIVIDDN
jgi:hypothetical protein